MAFSDACDGFGEGFTTGLTIEPAFSDLKYDLSSSEGGVFDASDSVIIDRIRPSGASGADFELGFLFHPADGFVYFGFLPFNKFKFFPEHKMG